MDAIHWLEAPLKVESSTVRQRFDRDGPTSSTPMRFALT